MNLKTSKTALILLAVGIIILAVAGVAVAATLFSQTNTNTANYSETAQLSATVNTVALPATGVIAWGEIAPGTTYTKTLAVTNTGNTALTVTLSATVPNGFDIDWAKNGQSVAVGATLTGALTLKTPAALTPQVYSWTTTINGAP